VYAAVVEISQMRVQSWAFMNTVIKLVVA